MAAHPPCHEEPASAKLPVDICHSTPREPRLNRSPASICDFRNRLSNLAPHHCMLPGLKLPPLAALVQLKRVRSQLLASSKLGAPARDADMLEKSHSCSFVNWLPEGLPPEHDEAGRLCVYAVFHHSNQASPLLAPDSHIYASRVKLNERLLI